MRNALVCILLLSAIGCYKKEAPERHVAILSSLSSVAITYVPNEPIAPIGDRVDSFIGNLDMHKRVFHIGDGAHTVYIKTSNDKEWENIPSTPGALSGPRYTYDPITTEIRFKDCFEGWAYTIYVIKHEEERIL